MSLQTVLVEIKGGIRARNRQNILLHSEAAVAVSSPQHLLHLEEQHHELLPKLPFSSAGGGHEHVITLSSTTTTTIEKESVSIDFAASTAYLCNILALSLPIVLVPLGVTEYAAALGATSDTRMIAKHVANICSVSAMGGALGKFINGFICKEMGTYACSKWFLVGLAFSSFAFSLSANPMALGIAFAGMEFFASVQCASFAIMISDYHRGNAAKITAGLTTLGLANTLGEVMAKVLGTSLTSVMHWRQVAQLGTIVAMIGAIFVSRAPGQVEAMDYLVATKQPFRWSSIVDSLKDVLGSGLFWKLSLAYSMCFLACGIDRVLGAFYNSVTNLPLGVCGALTLSVTLGLIHGLITGAKETEKLQTPECLQRFTKRRYIQSVAATLGLAAVAKVGPSLIPNGNILAGLVAFLSAAMASNVSYQCYQFPAMIAKKFADHQAVCISFLDGFGFLFSVPLFAALGVIVPHSGWSSGWAMLSLLFGAGAVVMMKSIPPILKLNLEA